MNSQDNCDKKDLVPLLQRLPNMDQGELERLARLVLEMFQRENLTAVYDFSPSNILVDRSMTICTLQDHAHSERTRYFKNLRWFEVQQEEGRLKPTYEEEYCAACVMLEILHGRSPFYAEDEDEFLENIIAKKITQAPKTSSHQPLASALAEVIRGETRFIDAITFPKIILRRKFVNWCRNSSSEEDESTSEVLEARIQARRAADWYIDFIQAQNTPSDDMIDAEVGDEEVVC